MRNHLKTTSLVLALSAGFPLGVDAQSAPAPKTFVDVVDVEVVNVEVFVTDKKGEPVVGLAREEFELLVNGQPTPISNFYAAVDGRPTAGIAPGEAVGVPGVVAPEDQRLHIVVVVDNDHIRAVNRKRVFRSLGDFLDSRLRDDDLVTVVSLNPALVVHSDFLTDRAAVQAMLLELERSSDRPRTQEMERRQIMSRLSTVGREYDRSTVNSTGTTFDAPDVIARIRAWAESEYGRSLGTLKTLGKLVSSMAGVRGRKALLFVSDGVPNRPGEEMFVAWRDRFGDGTPVAQGMRAVGFDTDYFREIGRFDLTREVEELGRLASAARVTWYSLDAESDRVSTLQGASLGGGVSSEALDVLQANVREPLELAAELTGGRLIQASTSLDTDLLAIGTDFGTYYSLGFTPPAGSEADEAKDYRIRVKVSGGKRYDVRHRENWLRRSPDDLSAERTTAALLYHAVTNPLGVELEAGAAQRRDDGNYVVPVEVRIPLAKLTLIPQGEAHVTQLSLYVTTRNRRGEARPVQKLPFNAAIPADKLEEALGRSTRYTLPMVVRPGDQQLAVGVRDVFGSTESYLRLDLSGIE